MAVEDQVVAGYLRSKLSSILQEAQDDPNSPSNILLLFRSIERQISFMSEVTSNRTSPVPVNLLYDLIDALSECRIFAHQRHKASSSNKVKITFSPLSNFLFKKNMKSRLDDIQMKLKNLPGEITVESSSSRTPLVIQQTYPILDASPVIGFESEVAEIERLLLEGTEEDSREGLTAIGIVGRCGCGKTALAQKVFASPRIQEKFYPTIWVGLSRVMLGVNQRVDARVRVLNYILEQLGHNTWDLEYADFNVIKLLEKVQRGLMGRRYLIVLDDAWRVDEFYADLGYGLPRGYATGEFFSHGLPKGNGGGIILTSRSDNVIRRMVGDKHVIRIEPNLNNNICRKIIADAVPQHSRIKPMLEKVVDDLIRNSDGLPLAARSLADIISELPHTPAQRNSNHRLFTKHQN